MKKSLNRIHPIVAILLTLVVAGLAVLFFVKMVLSFHRRGDRIIHGSTS